MIYILKGNVRTGKTTALLNWVKSRNDVDGLLCPDNEFGKRYFLKIKSNEQFLLEANDESENDIISVGPFNFLKSAFQKANNFLIVSAEKKNYNYLIIDELGKLELKRKGLYTSSEKIIKSHEFDTQHHVILVVRTSLLDEIIQHYSISQYELIEKDELKNFK